MNIHCICIAKDEEDILEESISAAATWADNIFIVDNTSTDKTPQIAQQLSKQFLNIHFLGSVSKPFTRSMIAEVFNQVKGCSRNGDWWCRLDSDEIYIDNPRDILRNCDPVVDTVWSQHFDFWFTEEDLYQWENNADYRALSVEQRMKFFCVGGSERRFVKHTFPFVWNNAWPKFRLKDSPTKIRLKQYQYRNPIQIKRRIENRLALYNTSNIFEHEYQRNKKQGGKGPPYSAPVNTSCPRVYTTKDLLVYPQDMFANAQCIYSNNSWSNAYIGRVLYACLFVYQQLYKRLKIWFFA
jgi:glycosyltransferase involved in cell wall biosynthesis